MTQTIIDTGIFDRPILIQNQDNKSRIVKEVKEVVIEDDKPIIIDTGIFDRPILVQPQYLLNENTKKVSSKSYVVKEGNTEVQVEEVVYEEFIDETNGVDGETYIAEEIVQEVVDEQQPTEVVVETVQEKSTETQVQQTESIVEEVIQEQTESIIVEEQAKPIIIDTGIFDRPILIQENVEQQPREVVVAQEEPVVECRGDTGLWWLFAKPETTTVVEEQAKLQKLLPEKLKFQKPRLKFQKMIPS